MVVSSEPKTQTGRSFKAIWRALWEGRHYRALKNIVLNHNNPVDFLGRYAFAFGAYPSVQKLRIGRQELRLQAYSWHDILTMNEIFFRKDYVVAGNERIIVDFGSNIGLSAAFFLASAMEAFCYLFEPLPTNISRLRKNLEGFDARYKLECAAVALKDGEEVFGFEETGRYGGIGVTTGSYLHVRCMNAVEILDKIIGVHGAIDVLKIDIEAFEREIVEAIPVRLLRKISKIFVEQAYESNPLAGTHFYIQYGSVAQFVLKAKNLDSESTT
jgi:FkbM family methyltransferase